MSITNLDIAHIRNSLKGNLIGSEIYYHSVIGSTMNESKQLADNGCSEGTVVIAEDPLSCVALGTGKALDQEETFSTMLVN